MSVAPPPGYAVPSGCRLRGASVMRAWLPIFTLLVGCLTGATPDTSFAAESACTSLDRAFGDGEIASGEARFDAGDTITVSATGDGHLGPAGGVVGTAHFTELPFTYTVPEAGFVAWHVPVVARIGAVDISCLPIGTRVLAGIWIVLASAISGALLIAIVTAGVRRYVTSAVLGILTASIVASLRPLPQLGIALPDSINQYLSILGLGIAGGIATCLVLSLALRMKAGIEALNWRARAEEARGELMPSRWAVAAGKMLPPRDIVRRWFVTVCAATGGMVASLGGLEQFLDALFNALAPGRIAFAILGATGALVFFGPLHDFVLEAGAGHGGTRGEKGSGIGDLLETITPQRIIRFAFAVLLAFLVVICGECVTEAARSSTVDAVVLIATAGLMPGVVTHFWAAALQYDAPSVEIQATQPVVVAGMVFSFPAAAALAAAIVLSDAAWQKSAQGGMMVLIGIPFMTLLLMFVLGVVNFGVFSFIGGKILDRRRSGGIDLFLVLGLVMVPLIVLVWTGLQAVAALIISGSLVPDLDRHQLLQQALVGVGWMAGLWLSGFPRLMQRRSVSAMPAAAEAEKSG